LFSFILVVGLADMSNVWYILNTIQHIMLMLTRRLYKLPTAISLPTYINMLLINFNILSNLKWSYTFITCHPLLDLLVHCSGKTVLNLEIDFNTAND